MFVGEPLLLPPPAPPPLLHLKGVSCPAGFRPYATTVWAVITGSGRKTISRVLVLLVSMGYGVVRPTLGGLSNRVLVLSVAYLCSSLALDLVTFVGAINDLTPATRMILVLPVALLDALFLTWVFTSLSRTLSQLHAKRKAVKLQLYLRFTWVLGANAVASLAFMIYELYFRYSDPDNEAWETDWLTTGWWHILNFLLLAAICYLWAPSTSSARYAYSEREDGGPSGATAAAEDIEMASGGAARAGEANSRGAPGARAPPAVVAGPKSPSKEAGGRG